MPPVVLRLSDPSWGRVLPIVLIVLAAGFVVAAGIGRRARNPLAFAAALLGLAMASFSAWYSWLHPPVLRPMVLHPFGVSLCVAALVAWHVSRAWVSRGELSVQRLPAAFVATCAGALLGAHLWFALSQGQLTFWQWLAVQHGGWSLWGALFGGLLGLRIWCARSREVFPAWAAALTPGAFASACLGQLGCYFSGAQFGLPLSEAAPRWLRGLGTFERWPDAVMQVVAGPAVWLQQVERGQIAASSLFSNPTHPVQLYEVVLLLPILATLWQRPQWATGQQLLWFVACFCSGSLALGWLRADVERTIVGPALAPMVALLGVATALTLVFALLLRTARVARVRRVQLTLAFALVYGFLSWLIAGQLHGAGLQAVRPSLAQWLALLGAVVCAVASVRGSRVDAVAGSRSTGAAAP
jgi:phosphatidylglycerol:prolipoprotein diacylglycerol transferase